MTDKKLKDIERLKELKIAVDTGDIGVRKDFYVLRELLINEKVPIDIELEQTESLYDNLKYIGTIHTVMESEVDATILILEQHGLKTEILNNYEGIPDSVDIEIYVEV